MEDKMRKSKCISTQIPEKRTDRTKKVVFEEMMTKNFPETLEEEAFTDAWYTAYSIYKNDKCISQKKMHLNIMQED